jgi:hypothetical protein
MIVQTMLHMLVLHTGVYSPSGTKLEESIAQEWTSHETTLLANIPPDRFDVKLQYETRNYNYTWENINTGAIHGRFMQHVIILFLVKSHLRTAGYSVIIGPYSQILVVIANDIQVPYLVTSRSEVTQTPPEGNYALSMVPHPTALQNCVVDFVNVFKWTNESVAIIYDDDRGEHESMWAIINMDEVSGRQILPLF